MRFSHVRPELIMGQSCGFGMTWIKNASLDEMRYIATPDFIFVDGNQVMTVDDLGYLAPQIDQLPALFASIDGPVQTAVAELGPQAHAVLSAHNPQSTAALASANTSLLDGIDRLGRLPLAGLVIVDNLCGGAGLLVNPMVVVGVLLQLYHDAIKQARALGLPCILRTSGDAREYFAGLKDVGFWGVNIAGCDESTTVDLFNEARHNDLVPVGGLTTNQVARVMHANHGDELDGIRTHLKLLASSGRGLICDDGELAHVDQIYRAHALISEVKHEYQALSTRETRN